MKAHVEKCTSWAEPLIMRWLIINADMFKAKTLFPGRKTQVEKYIGK